MKKYFLTMILAATVFAFAPSLTFAPEPAFAAQTKDATNTRDAYAPFEELIQVTASDATEYDPPLRGCIVETAGDLVLTTVKGDSDVTITVVAAQTIPAMITHVKAATTAVVVCGR